MKTIVSRFLLQRNTLTGLAGDTISVLPGDTIVDPVRLVPHRATWLVIQREPGGGTTWTIQYDFKYVRR
jgi:hypothetical protein